MYNYCFICQPKSHTCVHMHLCVCGVCVCMCCMLRYVRIGTSSIPGFWSVLMIHSWATGRLTLSSYCKAELRIEGWLTEAEDRSLLNASHCTAEHQNDRWLTEAEDRSLLDASLLCSWAAEWRIAYRQKYCWFYFIAMCTNSGLSYFSSHPRLTSNWTKLSCCFQTCQEM